MGIHTVHVECVTLLLICTVLSCTMLSVANPMLYGNPRGIHWFSLSNFCAFMGAMAVEPAVAIRRRPFRSGLPRHDRS